MTGEIRDLRNKIEGLDLSTPDRRSQGATFLGVVTSGGHMPNAPDRCYLVSPVALDGDQVEGQSATTVASASPVPVVILGNVPAVGDLVIASYAAGRWVARSGQSTTVNCWPCPIPRKNLNVHVVNPLIGDYDVTLIYTPPQQWRSACVKSLLFWLACPGFIAQFGVTYFLSGTCPSGQQQECSSAGAPPLSLTLGERSCDPFRLVYNVTGYGCPILSGGGYSSFTVTE